MVSRRTLTEYRTPPRARGVWVLDSGGFSELSLYGRWTVSAAQYAAEVRYYIDAVGRMEWAAAQDWIVEPFILEKTRLTLRDHQQRTVENYATLRAIAPEVPWLPVLQGWATDNYLRHMEDYAAAGYDLTELPAVGVGSICRRQGTNEAVVVLSQLAARGLRLHGFGLKLRGLERVSGSLVSADSMAWSYDARRHANKTGANYCGAAHASCSNCLTWAETWYRRVKGVGDTRPTQMALAL